MHTSSSRGWNCSSRVTPSACDASIANLRRPWRSAGCLGCSSIGCGWIRLFEVLGPSIDNGLALLLG